METLILNDGTSVSGRILPSGDGNIIFVYLYGISITDGVVMFSDSDKTCRITAISYGTEYVYEGFTDLYSADHEYGNCNLVMRKVVNNA